MLDGDVLSDFNTAFERNAHFAQNVNLSVQHILLQTEIGDAKHQHAAGHRVLVEHGYGIALVCQIISTAHTRRACTDHGDFSGVWLADLVEHFGHKAGFFIQIMVSNEALHFINGNCLVHAASGAFLFTAFVADSAADCREGIFFLNQFQRFGITPLCRQLEIALNSNVSRAGCLARSGSSRHGILHILTVIHIPCLLVIKGLRKLGVEPFITGNRFAGAELLSEADSVGRAVLYALTAGNALALINIGLKIGTDCISCAPHEPGA